MSVTCSSTARSNDLRAFTFDPDLSQPAENESYWLDGQARLTWQATPKHKIAWLWSQQKSCKCPSLITATTAPESGADNDHGYPLFITTGDWSAPLTNRILVEASVLYHHFNWGFLPYADTNPNAIGLTEQTTGVTFKARPSGWSDRQNRILRYRATLSYITGAHSFKVGFNNSTGSSDYFNFVHQPIAYRLNGGIPESDHAACETVPYALGNGRRHRSVCAGSLDDRSSDADRWPAIRLQEDALPRPVSRADRDRAESQYHDSRHAPALVEGPDAQDRAPPTTCSARDARR